ncbi:hypothetical protein [Ottowia oryzae]|uniref:Uncharacterized protein n=1 Tax=Ottowia oryzae TaxID=2109914 RepID=A0A2S0MCS5_9BURK|nr:hypothetical protein [Ottowia oryzae]AVO33699.1 hypothetical protein C6570_05070 [Ottowia oryzae]
MPSVQRYLSGRDNLVRTAALTASSVRPSTALERIAAQRLGGGRARLAGAYTGHEAARIDVEVVAAGGIPRASVPQFVGVGNGQLLVQGVDAAAALQSFTLTLYDLGIATEHAGLDVREVRLRARTPGAPGNSIRISVEPQLTRSATNWALLAEWSSSTARQSGVQWDFGGLPLNAKQELDGNSPRIVFGADPQVYRPFREYKDGDWQFGLSPALQRNVPAGTPVLSVSGGYVVTVTDGITTETFGDTTAAQPEIQSFYQLLLALQASALVEVAGVVAADRVVGGQASIDVPLRTQAWLLSLSGKTAAIADVAVPGGAPTQAVTVRCINDDIAGAERWSVFGDVSGALPVATTGVPYTSAAALFTVPRIDPAAVGSGRWSFTFTPISRGETEGLPSVCLRPFRLGRNAVARNVTFRYQLRPPPDCSCNDMPTPRLSLKCLGLDTTGGEAMALDAAVQSRLTGLYAWRSDFHESNFSKYYVPPKDLDYADAVTRAFSDCLQEVFEAAAALAEWDAAFTDMQADMVDLAGAAFNNYAGANLPDAVPHLTDQATAGTAFGAQTPLPSAYRPDAGGISETPMPQTLSNAVEQLVRRYTARMDHCRTLAGIVPKSDSSGADAGGCWIDHGDSAWWADPEGHYLPAFTNQPYISARRDPETGRAYSTMEFGFGLVAACPERLKIGDEITVRIESVDGDKPYKVGDEAVIQTIGAGPAWLAGGVDGTDEQRWRVAARAAGALADYVVPTDGTAVPPYGAAGVALQMAPGGIPFALGDSFSLAVEAGQFRWRKDGSVWTAPADIPADGQAPLADGITAHFDPGAAPSFVPGDAYQFLVHQPWAASHVQSAQAASWGWSGPAATMLIDFGAPQPLGAVGLARYGLPASASVTVALSADGAAWSAPLVMDMSRAVSVVMFGAIARYLRLTVANAEGGHIGWIWAGQPMLTDHHASSCQRRRQWAATRGDGWNAASMYAGVGEGWSLGWSSNDWSASRLLEADVVKLFALLDWAQQADEPLLFVPHFQHAKDACLVRFKADALEVGDKNEYQADDDGHRYMSAALELDPVYAA